MAVGAYIAARELEREKQMIFIGIDGLGGPAGTIKKVEDQVLAIDRALSMNARVLLLDEPTSSLRDDAVNCLFSLIAPLKRNGVAFVYVSHKMRSRARLPTVSRFCEMEFELVHNLGTNLATMI